MASPYLWVILVAALLGSTLPFLSGANLQVGNIFPQGINLLLDTEFNCTSETNGFVHFDASTGSLQYCDGAGWNRVCALDAGSLLSVLSPQILQNYVFCFNGGEYTLIGPPGSSLYACICYADEVHGYYNGERCEYNDECSSGTHDCDHICTDTIESFQCSCNTGYILDSDNRTCLDVNPPVVTVNPPEILYVAIGSTGFDDPGATAIDEDGDLTSSISLDDSTVNYNVAGTYTATYSVFDSAGNEGTVTRTIVVHEGFSLSAMYSDSMVLQREPLQACITGMGPAGWEVEVSVDGVGVAQSTTNSSGHWKMCLPPQPSTPIPGAGHIVSITRPPTANVSYAGLAATMNDVLFGDVFMCSGQSNMYQILWASETGPEEVANLHLYPHIRMFKMGTQTAASPVSSYELSTSSIMHQWHPAGPTSAAAFVAIGGSFGSENRGFSGVCWYFGRFTSNALNDSVPIGLIDTSWPGSNIETYMPDNALSACGASTGVGNKYNQLIHPFLDTTIAGAAWYQGESNAGNPTAYECLFREMITGWRTNWFHDFPFFFVQLAGYDSTNYAVMRGSQATVVSALENIGMAAAYDVGDRNSPWSGNIHPRFKRPVGRRLSLAAQNILYGIMDTDHRGPKLKNTTIISQSFPTASTVSLVIEVEFDFVPNSLIMNGTKDCTTCCTVSPFEIGGAGSFNPVDPVFSGNIATFTATLPISAVTYDLRYAYTAFPECAVYRDDADYVPAEPFNIRLPYAVDLPDINICDYLGPGCDGAPWQQTHEFPIPDTANYKNAEDLPYSYDCSATGSCPTTFNRIGYFLQLDDDWVWASMDAYTTDSSRIGIPIDWNVATIVTGLHVESNVLETQHHTVGKLEFWSDCYQESRPGYTDPEYDAYDHVTQEDCYGSMQVHLLSNTPVFAFNAWSCASCEYTDVGIGSAPSDGRDWTFQSNANTYAVKRMSIFVSNTPLYHPDYHRVYQLHMPPRGQYATVSDIPYTHSCALHATCFPLTLNDRVAYLMSLGDDYVFAELDSFATTEVQLGVPVGRTLKLPVTGVSATSTAFTRKVRRSGNIEFWHNSYGAGANAVFDYDDDPTQPVGYGSMQMFADTMTLFGYNSWGSSDTNPDDFTIGPATGSHPDGTFLRNGGSFTNQLLTVFAAQNSADIPAICDIISPGCDGGGWQLTYDIDLPSSGDDQWLSQSEIPYTFSCHETFDCPTSFSRIGYYLQLDNTWIWLSMDAYTTNASHTGIPMLGQYQGQIYNYYFETNEGTLPSIDAQAVGWAELFPTCYGKGDDGVYNHNDTITTSYPCYGSMQFFREDGTPLLAFNGFAHLAPDNTNDIGIGPNTGEGDPDYTFAYNSNDYSVLRLMTFVQNAPPICSVLAPGCDGGGWQMTYDMDLPTSGDDQWLSQAEIPYTFSCLASSSCPTSFTRIGYHLQIDNTWIWLSMDAFTTNASHTGVPMLAIYQGAMTNYHFETNQATLPSSDSQPIGRAEVFPNCYGPGADSTYNHDDLINTLEAPTPCYGSLQFFREDGTPLLAFNGFAHLAPDNTNDIGIGPNTGAGHSDYTFAYNTDSYTTLRLTTYVQ